MALSGPAGPVAPAALSHAAADLPQARTTTPTVTATADGADKWGLRMTTVVGAVLIPALISVTPTNNSLERTLRIATWVVSLVVAVSAALEQFFRFGERWRNYRRTAERLKTEGWLYFQMSGPYSADGATHKAAFTAFANRVEEWIKSDVDVYLTEIAVEKEKQGVHRLRAANERGRE